LRTRQTTILACAFFDQNRLAQGAAIIVAPLYDSAPGPFCTVHFAEKYPCSRLPAGAIAFRTKHVLEQSKGRVVQLTWHNPQHCDLVVHEHTPLGVQEIVSQISLDRAGQVVARNDSARVVIQKPQPLARSQDQQRDRKGTDKASKRHAGVIKLRDSHGPGRQKLPSSDKLGAGSREPAVIRIGTDERHLDATRGAHVFREYGSAQFGSMPSHNEFDE
jgi:hypothetical protein